MLVLQLLYDCVMIIIIMVHASVLIIIVSIDTTIQGKCGFGLNWFKI
jgi:hypothetical protein